MRIMIRNTKRYAAAAVLAMMAALSACAGTGRQQTMTGNNIPENISEDVISYEGLVAEPAACGQKNIYDTLNVATYITRIDHTYFIVDCYHDQIIYHDNITDPLNQWSVLTDEVHYAHTIASDGTVFVIDDTEHNRLMVFQKTEAGYVHIQTLENIGMRPHYVQYDAENQVFMNSR